MNTFRPVDDQLLQEMVRVIVQETDPVRIILFGSHASGTARADSDLDLLVVEKEPFGVHRSRRMEATRLWRALARFRVPKDILVFTEEEVTQWRHAANHVIGHAVREGRILYGKNY